MLAWQSWETIPFHFIWVSLTLALRLPRLAARPDASPLLALVVRRRPALILDDVEAGHAGMGRAVRGAADVGDVPRDGLARAAPPGRDGSRASPRRARCSSARSGSSTTLRTSCARRSRSRAATSSCSSATARARTSSRSRKTSSADGVDRRAACCCSRRPTSRTSSCSRRSSSRRSSRTSSCAGPRSGRAPGASAASRPGRSAADADALRIALDALIENAVEHSAPGEAIEITAVAREGRRDRGADDGHGIAPDALDRIFERFARADPARSRAAGRRRPRPRDRRRDRQGARRQLHRGNVDARIDLRTSASRL